jgi:hypothetical protein
MGYPEPEWTGLNMSLKRNEVVQEYLEKHGLAKQFGLSNKERQGSTDTQQPGKKVRFSSDT